MQQGADLLKRPAGAQRFTLRSLVGLVVLLAAGTGFALMLALVQAQWSPLHQLDQVAVAELNAAVSAQPAVIAGLSFVTDLGDPQTVSLLLSLTAIWLLVRKQAGLAVYVAVTGLGAGVLSPGLKELIARARPVVDVPVASAPGMSFPSGHAFGSLVAYGVILLVFLPVVPPRARRPLIAAAGLLVASIGASRVALGVHYVSDVLGGWLLAGAWLALTAGAFREWRREAHLPARSVADGLTPEAGCALAPAASPDAPADGVVGAWPVLTGMLVGWVLLVGLFVAAGRLLTDGAASTWIGRLDLLAVEKLAGARTAWLNAVSDTVAGLTSSAVTRALSAVLGVLTLAWTRRWRPALLVAAVMVGEVLTLATVGELVGRPGPAVAGVDPIVPRAAGFPSARVAATVALYGVAAVLAHRHAPRWTRLAAAVGAVVALLASWSGLYSAAYFPTDILAGILLAIAWLALCSWALPPTPGRDKDPAIRTEAADADAAAP